MKTSELYSSIAGGEEMPIGKTSIADLELEAFGDYYQRIDEQPLEEKDVPLSPG
jgi:hypothetical protein